VTSSRTVARQVVVHGRVQGVFFRDSCRQQAEAAGVAGWVRNRYDGAVEAHFEGPGHAVEALLRWTHEGPPHARVERVDVSETAPTGATGFEVRG
jgi:acylphosphatase